jgi:pimeloyl-ACP methyl ester carboxylesterase
LTVCHVESGGEVTTFITLPGAWHGAWAVERFNDALRRHGHEAIGLTLPSLAGADRRGIPADVEAVQRTLDRVSGDVVLIGHSYAGVVITEAGMHPAVHQLVYLAAFIPDLGETSSSLMSTDTVRHSGEATLRGVMRRSVDPDLLELDPALVGPALYADCDAADQAAAIARLEPHVGKVFSQAPQQVAWRTKPSLFVICSQDRAIPPSLQRRMAQRASACLELNSSHSPFLSMPLDLADTLHASLHHGLGFTRTDPTP